MRLNESGEAMQPSILAYLNRLSDLLWLFARKLELDAGVNSSLRAADRQGWQPVVARLVNQSVVARLNQSVSAKNVAAACAAVLCLCAAPVEAADPARIVSTSPSITETLFALGLGDRVVGVSTYCRYPQAALRLPKVGSFMRPDAELIARLRPDLVIVHAGPHTVPQQLSALGIASITVDRGTLAGVYSSIRAIGAAAGVADRAARLVAELEARLAAVQRAARRDRRGRCSSSSAASPGRSAI